MIYELKVVDNVVVHCSLKSEADSISKLTKIDDETYLSPKSVNLIDNIVTIKKGRMYLKKRSLLDEINRKNIAKIRDISKT